MNIETGQMGEMGKVLADAKPGERVIPATIIGVGVGPKGKYANKKGVVTKRVVTTVSFEQQDDTSGTAVIADDVPRTGAAIRSTAPLYGPRKPLREVRQELDDAAARATNDDDVRI